MNKEARMLVYGNVSQLSSQPSSPRRSNWHNMTLNLEQFQVRVQGLLEVGLTLIFFFGKWSNLPAIALDKSPHHVAPNARARRPLLLLQNRTVSFQVLQDALLSSPSASKVLFSAILLLPLYIYAGGCLQGKSARITPWSTVALCPFPSCAHSLTLSRPHCYHQSGFLGLLACTLRLMASEPLRRRKYEILASAANHQNSSKIRESSLRCNVGSLYCTHTFC
jgi:hypothetical protein